MIFWCVKDLVGPWAGHGASSFIIFPLPLTVLRLVQNTTRYCHRTGSTGPGQAKKKRIHGALRTETVEGPVLHFAFCFKSYRQWIMFSIAYSAQIGKHRKQIWQQQFSGISIKLILANESPPTHTQFWALVWQNQSIYFILSCCDQMFHKQKQKLLQIGEG